MPRGKISKSIPSPRFQGSNLQVQEGVGGNGGGKKNLEELLERFINRSEDNYKNQEAAIKSLENQFGQLAKQMSEIPQGKSFSNARTTITPILIHESLHEGPFIPFFFYCFHDLYELFTCFHCAIDHLIVSYFSSSFLTPFANLIMFA